MVLCSLRRRNSSNTPWNSGGLNTPSAGFEHKSSILGKLSKNSGVLGWFGHNFKEMTYFTIVRDASLRLISQMQSWVLLEGRQFTRNAGGIGIFHYPNIFNFPKNNHNLGQNNDILSFPKFGPHSPILENLKFRGKSTGPFPCWGHFHKIPPAKFPSKHVIFGQNFTIYHQFSGSLAVYVRARINNRDL